MTLALGSCLRSNDAWGAGRRGLMVVEGPLRVPSGQAQGERIWEVRVRWGVGDAMWDGDAPRRAPALGSRVRGNDARGGVRKGREVGTSPRLAPALGSRESGNDDGGCGGMRWREGLLSGWGPALAGGRFSNRPYDRGGAHEGGGDAGAAGGGGPGWNGTRPCGNKCWQGLPGGGHPSRSRGGWPGKRVAGCSATRASTGSSTGSKRGSRTTGGLAASPRARPNGAGGVGGAAAPPASSPTASLSISGRWRWLRGRPLATGRRT